MKRTGIVRFDPSTHECYIIWDDKPCRPEIFPLISKHKIHTPPQYFPVYQEHDKYTICIPPIHSNSFFWAGIPTLTFNTTTLTDKEATRAASKTSRFQTKTSSMLHSPIEVSKSDTKHVTIPTKTELDRSNCPIDKLKMVKWDSKNSVVRDIDTNKVIGVPNWTTWKTLVNI